MAMLPTAEATSTQWPLAVLLRALSQARRARSDALRDILLVFTVSIFPRNQLGGLTLERYFKEARSY